MAEEETKGSEINVVVGDELGQVKVVELKERHLRGGANSRQPKSSGSERNGGDASALTTGPEPYIRRWSCGSSSGGPSNAVVSLSPCPSETLARLGVETGSEKPEQVYLVARRRGVVDCLDAASGSSRPFFQAKVEDGEELVGLKTAAGGKVLSCSSKGKVEIWVHQDLSDSSSEEDSLVCQTGDGAPGPLLSRSLAEISASAPVETFEVCPRGLTFATGGRENNAKLFDVETQKNVFQARSPKPNQLGIWDKPWITSLCFLDQSSSKVLLCGTANHQLRLYDTRVKRRPIFEIEWGENKITSLCLHPEEGANRANASGVWCGSAIGQLAMLDLKMKAMNGSLKGTLGSVRDLYMHPTKPLLFSCGLDRFLRVYDVQKRQQVCRVFLKQYTNAVKVAMPEEVLDKLLLTNTKDDEDVENDHRRDLGSHRRPKPSKKGPSKKKRKL